jgi:hypothetical protein
MIPVYYTYTPGYWEIDSYPWYVHDGFRYRYSPVDQCQYDLVNGETNTVERRTELTACNVAYDQCAADRDALNSTLGVDQYFCAESVEDDLAQTTTTEYAPVPNTLSVEQQTRINNFLSGLSLHDLFSKVYYGGVGSCAIVKLRGNEHGCKYIVTVKDEYFPDPEGEICSEDRQASYAGCNVGDEKQNAACLVEKAVLEGYCI